MFAKGSAIICKNNDNGQLFLTVGKEYLVIRNEQHQCVLIKNDNGVESGYLSSRFTPKESAPAKQIKLEVGKSYLTAGGYVVHITALKLSDNEYYTTIQCSPGYNCNKQTIQEMLATRDHNREGDFKKYGWAYRSDGTLTLGDEWSEKLRIIDEFSKLKPAPQGFRYAGGFPQARPPKKDEWYMCCMSGDAIQASNNESERIVRVIIEKEENSMPPLPSLPEGFKFTSNPPEYRKPKKGEWYIGLISKPEKAEVDFLNASYHIITKIEEKSDVYPKYYETSDRAYYAYRERVSETEYRVVHLDGTLGTICKWNSRGGFPDHELTKEVALGRVKKPDAQKVEESPTIKLEVYPKYYSPLNIKDWAFIKRTSQFNHVLTKYDGTEVVSDVGWCKHHDALYVEIPEEVALAQIKRAQTPAPQEYVLASDVFTTSAIPKKSMLSYWVAEPIENMLDAAKKSARYVVASSLLAGIGYVSFNPVESLNFVSSCLPKIHIKFGDESPKFVPIREQDVSFVIPMEK